MRKIFLFVVILIVIVFNGGNMSPVGTPDYGNTLSSTPTVQSFDTGEDTTRLLMGGGSFSRSGRWLWATGFESGLAEFAIFPVGGGTIITIDSTHAYMGKSSLKLLSGAGVGHQATLEKSFYSPVPVSVSSRFGLENMFALQTIGNQECRIFWQIRVPSINNPGNVDLYRVYLIPLTNSTGNLYVGVGGALVLIANVNSHIFESADLYHYGKLVIDAGAKSYVSFTFDGDTYLLPNTPPNVTLVSNQGYIETQIGLISVGAASIPVVLLDNVVITADEP